MFEAKQLTEHGKIYLQAANLLEQKGWCQHIASDRDDKVCLAEALVRSIYDTPDVYSIYDTSDGYYRIKNPMKWRPVYASLSLFIGEDPIVWNDAPGRTKAEVIEKLREAAYNPVE